MATWPAIGEVRSYIGEVLDDDMPVLEECFLAATEKIQFLIDDDLILEDAEYVDIVPHTIRMAIMLQSSRWFRRRLSPEGIGGFGEFGAVRVASLDTDIMDAVTSSGTRSWGFA
jgi:hypothetical protein